MAIERVKVTGVKFFKGNVEGTDYDNGNIFVEEMLDFTLGRAKGYATTLYKCGKAEAAQVLMNLEFPLVAEVEFMRVTNGDTTKNIVMSVRPLPTERVGGVDKKAA
jgi:hypothetical protein